MVPHVSSGFYNGHVTLVAITRSARVEAVAASIALGADRDLLSPMASLATVPVELVREIVQYVLNGDLELPVVGRDAAWITPPPSRIIWKRGVPWDRARDFNEEEDLQEEDGPAERAVDRGGRNHRPHCTLKALRR